VIFWVANFSHFAKSILKKEYFVANSLFKKKNIARKPKKIPKNCQKWSQLPII